MEHTKGCKLTEAMELLSKRWMVLVINTLLGGPLRFSEIENSLPISGRILSERLKELEAAGMVSRVIYPEVPVRVEYSLTDKGKAFEPIVSEIRKWAESWSEEVDVSSCPSACGESEA
ncbi:winged helix-turn-helix transcriptional regulator [Paenibacillus alkalitolerans]|uniref:winged helix-turn-helix transcriptional regulator n=1 Tax=Paenibacillus alkalitolerans TaxID=2799335 RepID=UPI0018F4E6B2|nr:helix-turn-helix domain-containing protein [Paenibacillus alkalitolerans]